MNIAIGKSGRSMYFNEKKWSIFSGDDSPLIMYYELAKRYPQHTFYIIGASDFLKCKESGMDVPSNIEDLWNLARRWEKENGQPHEYPYQMLLDYINMREIKFDLGLIMQGPDMQVSIQGKGIRCIKDPSRDIHPLCLAVNYVAPLEAVLNEQMFPYYLINEDPRYVPIKNRDLINDEKCILSQINCERKAKRISGYDELATKHRQVTLKYKYAGTERMFLNHFTKIDFRDPNNIKVGDNVYKKTNKFVLAVNGGGGHGGKDRLDFIEKWVLNIHPDQIIYGKWSDDDKEKHPGVFIEKGIIDLHPEMWSSMFTFIPGFDKRVTNFVTQKVWKMLYFGIIPFWDKHTYDTDNLLKFPDICKVESPEEMWKRINYLYANPQQYKKLLNWAYATLKDEYFNGDFIDKIFGSIIQKYDKK